MLLSAVSEKVGKFAKVHCYHRYFEQCDKKLVKINIITIRAYPRSYTFVSIELFFGRNYYHRFRNPSFL